MKKLTTALLAAGLIVTASACSAPTQLTTKETCDRIKIVVSDTSASGGKAGMTILANRMRPLAAGASDELKTTVEAIRDYADESAKETPDEDKMGELEEGYQKAGTTFGQLCQ